MKVNSTTAKPNTAIAAGFLPPPERDARVQVPA